MKCLPLVFLLTALLPTQEATHATTDNYGTGCNGNLLSLNLPLLGATITATIINNDALTGIVGIGFGKVNIPLGGGCTILANVFSTVLFTSLGGNGSVTLFTIPNDPTLVGARFFTQAVSFDSNMTGWSNGVESTIGF